MSFSVSESKSLKDLVRVGEVGPDGGRGEDTAGLAGACWRREDVAWAFATVRRDVIEELAVGVATTEESVDDRAFGGFSHGGRDARASGDAGFR